jgi:hypothetical protein
MHPARLRVLLFAVACLAADPAFATRLRDIFVEFPTRRADLGRTVVLVDVVVVDDIAGKVEKVKLGRSRADAERAATGIAQRLGAHGVTVDTALVATIGATLDLLAPFQTDSIEASGVEDTAHVVRAPFFAIPAFADREGLVLWRSALDASFTYGRKRKKPPGYVRETIDLGARIGCDTVVMLAGVSWGLPATKQLLAAIGGVSASSRSTYWLMIADARSGEVLWKHLEVFETASGGELEQALDRFAKELP